MLIKDPIPLEKYKSHRRTAVSVLVCTRHRGRQIAATVRSILASTLADFELIIVDQSIDNETAFAVEPFATDRRLRYVRTHTVGKGTALNLGLSLAGGDVVALTDDDCEVPPNWLTQVTDLFNDYPRLAAVYTSVAPAAHNRDLGFVPTCEYDRSRLVTSIQQMPWGLGAAAAVRANAVRDLGGVDAMLGPGAPFYSAEDTDLMLRLLLKDYFIYELSETAVVHHGFRTWEMGRHLMQRDWFALGAVYAKLLRRRDRAVLPFIWHEVSRKLLLPPLQQLIRRRRLSGFVPIRAFVQGLWRGWQTAVDPHTLRFSPEVTQ